MKARILCFLSLFAHARAFVPVASPIVRSSPTQLSDSSSNIVDLLTQRSAQDMELVLTTNFIALVGQQVVDFGLFYHTLPIALKLLLVFVPLHVFAIHGVLTMSHPKDNYRKSKEPYPRGVYNQEAAKDYYKQHQVMVLTRVLEIVRLSNKFMVSWLFDRFILKDTAKHQPQRAQELLELITKLGPTAIKAGQALSVREDLIAPEYVQALSKLQDRVPPFDNNQAKELLKAELGEKKYQELGIEGQVPVASASIGQVYKCRLGSQNVAVKIQRPNVLSEIALDLYIGQEYLAPLYELLTGQDIRNVITEWGRGFIAELDYRTEAASTMEFNRAMQKRQLTAVCAPNVISKYSSTRVLVTEWIDGTRIDKSDASDIPRLCGVALNAYLVMLLELNKLHCDPHPGNLLRTKDGRLCILDFGMTLDIDKNLQYSLLQFVAHLTSENFEDLADDLVNLGFLHADKLEFAKTSGILEPIRYFLKQAGDGGGVSGVKERMLVEYRGKYPGLSDEALQAQVRMEMESHMTSILEQESATHSITSEVEALQRKNKEAFLIPDWFLYTSRAFLTLEGVTLQHDEGHSLIKSSFPYIAKRLVGDDDPRARKALHSLVYGTADSVDVDRISQLADGFSSYTAATKSMQKERSLKNAEATINLAKDSADIVLAESGNLVQSMLVEEGALLASANFKDGLKHLVEGPKRLREKLPLGSFLPKLPFEDQLEPFVKKTAKEEKAQQLAEKLTGMMSPTAGVESLVRKLRDLEPDQAALVIKELRENLPKYAPKIGKLGGKFVSTLLNTASQNIESTLDQLEHADLGLRATAKGLSDVAKNGATVISASNKESSSR